VLSGWGTDLTATPTPTPDSAADGAPDLGAACAGTCTDATGLSRLVQLSGPA
jgi:hypothetical protein